MDLVCNAKENGFPIQKDVTRKTVFLVASPHRRLAIAALPFSCPPRHNHLIRTGDAESLLEMRMHKLYSMQRSGNCYKVRLALAQLDIPYENVEIDILKGETHTPDFLAKNPNGQIPLLETAPGRYLAESNAILWFLAEGHPLLGDDPVQRASVLQWLFFEQHAIVPNIGAAYFWLCLVRGGRELQRHALDDWMEEGQRSLNLLDKHLSARRYIAGDRYSIADIALYAYTHLAEQCDFDLSPFPALRVWLARVAAEPGHIGMDWTPISLKTAAE